MTFRDIRAITMIGMMRRLTLALAVVLGALLILSFEADSASAYSGPSRGDAADPFTLVANGHYYTYATNTTVPAGCFGAGNRILVPVLQHGNGEATDLGTQCPIADALVDGVGSWAEPRGQVWAPGVVRFGGRYILYYSATKRGTVSPGSPAGQMCIGKAYSANPQGPFADAGEWACPGGGRWAIDPNPFVGNDGKLYVTYRDDAVTAGAAKGLSVVQADSSGAAVWSTRRTLRVSSSVPWAANTIENPSMLYMFGSYYLTYSGNNWQSNAYSTALEKCSGALGPCTPLGGFAHPYFGYLGAGGVAPQTGLPMNKPGPGGMSLLKTASGQPLAIWHYLSGGLVRPALIGGFKNTGGNFSIL